MEKNLSFLIKFLLLFIIITFFSSGCNNDDSLVSSSSPQENGDEGVEEEVKEGVEESVKESEGGILSIISVEQVEQLTGQLSPNKTESVNVYGAELGSMFMHSDGKVYFLFGDSFGLDDSDWRSNTMAYTTDFIASDGITFDGWITDTSGQAAALLEGEHDLNNGLGEVTKIPTAGWSIGDRQFLWYMSIKEWEAPGLWAVNHAEIAYSDDDGESWVLSGAQHSEESHFIQVAIAEHSGYLYIWGTPAGRFGGVKLARVLPENFLDTSEYRFFTGTEWSADEDEGILIVEPPAGELSVVWNSYLKRWIMMYLNESNARIELREAKEPTGPWSEAWEVTTSNEYPALYGAYMHDAYIENDGETVYFLMSQFWSYNVFLMKMEFEVKS